MPKQKRGFLLFLCSLVPGAGEMYMGFFKQGLSIMALFWGSIAVASAINLPYLIFLLPLVWAYSFFHVHNLKGLSEEDFQKQADTYVLHLDSILENTEKLAPKSYKILAVFLIIFGISIAWNSFCDLVYWIFPESIADAAATVMYKLPTIVVGLFIILVGYHILTGKVKAFRAISDENKQPENQEHYWQPYRPYEQPVQTVYTDNMPAKEVISAPLQEQEPIANDEQEETA